MTEFVLVLLLFKGFDPIAQSTIDGFSNEDSCEYAASELISAYQSMYATIGAEYKCVSIVK